MSARGRLPRAVKRGQAIPEMAVTMLLFLLLVFAVIEGAMLILAYVDVNQAVEEGGRLAVLENNPEDGKPVTEAQVKARVVSAAQPLVVGESTVAIAVTDPAGAGKGFGARVLGDRVRVTATYDYHPFFADMFFGGTTTLTLTGRTELMVEK